MKPILEIRDISKKFKIATEGQSYLNLRDSLSSLLKKANKNTEEFWALKDVSFEVNTGDSIGIIGKNGAGKSTLLKILSKITPPTKGSIISRGRIASLLEVGTGFHPELSGRENVFLNGSILGMKRTEIQKNFDAIIDFAGVEKFLDTPLKHYSSGMQLRLAFAVAAFLENEILIIDEVLAVGDAEFQKKCMGKMSDLSKTSGRTVLFVSHNMAAVKSLCNRALVLEKGTVKMIDSTENAISYYLKGDTEVLNQRIFSKQHDKKEFSLHEIAFRTKGRTSEEPLIENFPIEFITDITLKTTESNQYHLTYHLYNEMGEAMFSFSHKGSQDLRVGRNRLVCEFPAGFFNSGTYYLSLYVIENNLKSVFTENDIMSFTIIDGDRPLGAWMGREPGYIKPNFNWSHLTT